MFENETLPSYEVEPQKAELMARKEKFYRDAALVWSAAGRSDLAAQYLNQAEEKATEAEVQWEDQVSRMKEAAKDIFGEIQEVATQEDAKSVPREKIMDVDGALRRAGVEEDFLERGRQVLLSFLQSSPSHLVYQSSSSPQVEPGKAATQWERVYSVEVGRTGFDNVFTEKRTALREYEHMNANNQRELSRPVQETRVKIAGPFEAKEMWRRIEEANRRWEEDELRKSAESSTAPGQVVGRDDL